MVSTNKFASEKLNPALRTSVENMATKAQEEAGIDLRISPGGGRRDFYEQTKLFLSRYTPAESNQRTFVDAFDGATRTVIPFNGKNYMKKLQNREPPAAAPGDSLHEIGMAADLDLSDTKTKAWVKANLWRFGLASGDGEDYHVQLGWTKNMGVKKFLGETALTLDQASKNARSSATPEQRWARRINPGFGVDMNEFSEAFLKKLGTTITIPKLQWLKAWTQMEGGGGSYNPLNVISGNNRRTVDGRDRTETNFNSENGPLHPVQNFDSLDQGVNYTLSHLGNYQKGFMKLFMQPNPSIEDFKAQANRNTGSGSKGVLNNIDSVVKRYNQAVTDKDYAGIARNYGSTGTASLGLVGDPQPSVSPMTSSPMFIPNTSISSSNMGMSGGNTVNEGSTITISPVINMTSSGANGSVSEYDLRLMAKRIVKLIEQETNINKIRSM